MYLALEDHQQYHQRPQLELQRFIGVVLRNKGLSTKDQIRDPRKFYPLIWDKVKEVKVPTKEEWAALDRKYNRKTK